MAFRVVAGKGKQSSNYYDFKTAAEGAGARTGRSFSVGTVIRFSSFLFGLTFLPGGNHALQSYIKPAQRLTQAQVHVHAQTHSSGFFFCMHPPRRRQHQHRNGLSVIPIATLTMLTLEAVVLEMAAAVLNIRGEIKLSPVQENHR